MLWRVALAAACGVLASCASKGEADRERDTQDLRRLTQENLDAIAPGDEAVWRRNAHGDLVHVAEDGTVRGKPALLAELEPLPPGLAGRLVVEAFAVRFHGDTAVVTHEDRELLDYHGQKLESRWRTTDTWIRTPDGWQLVAEQVLALPVDPPAMALPRDELCAYAGRYALTDAITSTATCTDEDLVFECEGRPPATWRPELKDVFFEPGRPRTRRIFERGADGALTGFVDRREGHGIRWRRLP